MSALLLLAIAGAAGCGAALLSRLARVERELDELLVGPGNAEIRRILGDRAGRSLLPAADGRGLRSIVVPATEPHDREGDARALLVRIAGQDRPRDPRDHEARINALLQLGHAFGLEDAATRELLQPAIEDLIGQDWLGRKVAAVAPVGVGDTIDRETMWPLSTGTRVRYPLGAVIRDRDGKVLSRAKVLCG